MKKHRSFFLGLLLLAGVFSVQGLNASEPVRTLDQAWQHYHQTLDVLRRDLEATPRYGNPDHRAMAYYGLLEAQAMVYNWVIAPRLDNPRVFSHTNWNTYLYTLGQNNPDSAHAMFTLDGRYTYRLKGRVGDLKVMAMKVYDTMLGQPDTKDIGDYDLTAFAREDGTFELVFSASKQEGNWIPIREDSRYNFILVRRYLGDWFDDLGELRLERVDGLKDDSGLTEQDMVERIDMATHLMAFFVKAWNIGFHDSYIQKVGRNRLDIVGGASMSESTGSRLTTYGLGIFDCGPDEAIIIESDVPDAAYWSYQLGDVWAKSLDFMGHQTDVNSSRAVVDRDGKIRIVIAHQDPGVPNWMDAMGHTELLVAMRIFKDKNAVPPPVISTVKFVDVHKHLPADSRKVTPAERKSALDHRFRGLTQLWDR